MKSILAATAALLALAAPAQAYMEDYMLNSAVVLNQSTEKINKGIAAEKAGDKTAACSSFSEAYMLAAYANQKLAPNPYWFKVEPLYQQAINRVCF